MAKAGYENTTEDHFGLINAYVDMVVHPATVLIVLDQYGKTGNAALIDQAIEEMLELSTHIQSI